MLAQAPAGSRPASILDVGCGTGRLLRRAGSRWPAAQLIGVDPAEGMLEVARRLDPGGRYSLGAAESLPLPDASVDLALTTLSFHHWSDGKAGIRDVARVLRPGGCFLLADVSLTGVWALLIRHFGALSPEFFRGAFQEAGLRVQAQERVFMGKILVSVGIRP